MTAQLPLTASELLEVGNCHLCNASLFWNERDVCGECQLAADLCAWCQDAPLTPEHFDVGLCEDCFATFEAQLCIEAAWEEHEEAVLADGWRAANRDLYLPVSAPVVLRKLA